MPENQPIAVAMSGGVDSSVVAALLARQGHPVVGLTMQLWNQRRLPELASEGATGRCCSLDDVYDARHVAGQIGIPYYVINFEDQFEEHVVKPFVAEYLAGRTPIPCTLCNNYVKFDQVLRDGGRASAHTRSPRDITLACATTMPRAAGNCCAAWTRGRTRPISSSA